MELDLQGQTAVVTGASRGIGLAITQALIAEGATVVAGARSTTPALAELVASGGAIAVEVDLTDPEAPERLVRAAGGPIDIVVNNVGNAPARPGGFLSVTDDQWLATFGLNLMPAVRTVRAALPAMLEAGRGSIITVCSVNSILADPMVIDYGAAKAALAELLEGALEGGRTEGRAGQHREPRAGSNRPVAERSRGRRHRCVRDRSATRRRRGRGRGPIGDRAVLSSG